MDLMGMVVLSKSAATCSVQVGRLASMVCHHVSSVDASRRASDEVSEVPRRGCSRSMGCL